MAQRFKQKEACQASYAFAIKEPVVPLLQAPLLQLLLLWWSEAGTRNKRWNSKLKCQVVFCTKAKERRRQGNGHLYMPNRHKTACLSILEYTGGSLLLSMESVGPLCSS